MPHNHLAHMQPSHGPEALRGPVPRSAEDPLISKNLQRQCSLRLGHRAVLAPSKSHRVYKLCSTLLVNLFNSIQLPLLRNSTFPILSVRVTPIPNLSRALCLKHNHFYYLSNSHTSGTLFHTKLWIE